MTKEDIKKQLETIKGLSGNTSIVYECLLGSLASINYQLTRIADAHEQIANPLIQVGKDGVLRSVPVPDALVEAVKEIDWDGEIEQAPKRMDGNYTDDSHEKSVYHFGLRDGLLEAKKIVEIALADHKKAGVSGYDRFKGHTNSPDCRCYDCQLKSES